MEVLDRILFAFIGAAIAWLLQQYRLARSEDIALVNEHIKDIERFSESAQAYWLKKPADEDEELQLSAKVRAHHAATTLLYSHVREVCNEHGATEYARLCRGLFRVATADQFESSSRGVDPLRAIEIADTSAQLVHCLRLQRADILSLSRLWGSGKQVALDLWTKVRAPTD